MHVTLSGIIIDARLLQLLKACSPILVTLGGIIVFAHPAINLLVFVSIMALQLLRESYSGFLSATIMDIRASQPAKTDFPILVTPWGIAMDIRLLQHAKAYSSIFVTLSGRIMDVRAVQS